MDMDLPAVNTVTSRSIRIIRHTTPITSLSTHCKFWFGMYLTKKGGASFRSLSSRPLFEALHTAVNEGLDEDSPLLLTDPIDPHDTLRVYLMPVSRFEDEAFQEFCRKATENLQALDPESMGIYLSDIDLTHDQYLMALKSLSHHFFTGLRIMSLHIPVISRSYNHVLDAAIAARSFSATRGKDVTLMH